MNAVRERDMVSEEKQNGDLRRAEKRVHRSKVWS